VTAVVPEPRQAPQRDPVEGGRRGVVAQDGRSEFAAEIPDIAGEPREAEVDEPVELPHPVAEVLDQAIAKPDEFAQLLGSTVGPPGGGRPLLGREAGG
jgi:hypothetical protein